MLLNSISPIELNRNSISSGIHSNSNSNSRPNFTKISPVSTMVNTLNISAIVSTASPISKKRARTPDKPSSEAIDFLRKIHPKDYAQAAFKANGFEDFAAIASDSEARLIPPTAAMMEAYSTEIVNAVRNNDLDRAKTLYKEGRFQHGCNACNRFGESILHIACRRGHLSMVRFLMDEVGLSCTTIRDDYHRTPLHDAFWTSTASYDVIDYLLKQPNVTELLLCKDKRGYTPLDYSRDEDRGRWLRFLWERRSILRPMGVSSTKDVEDDLLTSSPSKRQKIMG